MPSLSVPLKLDTYESIVSRGQRPPHQLDGHEIVNTLFRIQCLPADLCEERENGSCFVGTDPGGVRGSLGARQPSGPNASPTNPGNESPSPRHGLHHEPGSTTLPRCTHMSLILTVRHSSPGRMSPKRQPVSLALARTHMCPSAGRHFRRNSHHLAMPLRSSSPLLKVPTTPSSPSSRGSANKPCSITTDSLAIASDNGAYGVYMRSRTGCTGKVVSPRNPGRGRQKRPRTTSAMIDRRTVALHQTVLFRLVW